MAARLFLVEDDPLQLELLSEALGDSGYEVRAFTSGAAALKALEQEAAPTDLVLTDVGMQGMDGLALCRALKESRPGLPVIVITGESRQETAVEALRAGAYDFLTKPIQIELLLPCVARAVERQELARELRQVKRRGQSASLLGKSPAMDHVRDLIDRVAASGASVLIHGETGTGKELVARELHQLSPRAKAPFVAINCAALPASLVESELFGYTKGAFTDARAARAGLFVEASGGTLFLDEVAELSLDNQAKLLRALQERKVRPLGASAEVAFDARVLCATHKDLDSEVEAGRFRQDLFYRLNVIRIDLPPLRQRGMDIIELAQLFVERVATRDGRPSFKLPPELAEKLLAYSWPGNVRELENCIERITALSRTPELSVADLPEKIRDPRPSGQGLQPASESEVLPLEELEKRYILQVLEVCGNNRSRAAELLGIDRRTLYRRMDAWAGITAEPPSEERPG
jgi:DNA-binding NtrC family response regulator